MFIIQNFFISIIIISSETISDSLEFIVVISFSKFKIKILATSNGSTEGMNNTRLGLCVTANMRLRIDVRPLNDHFHPSSERGGGPNVLLVSEQILKTEKPKFFV